MQTQLGCGCGVLRPAAIAPIRPLAWEPPYVTVAALKGQKSEKKKKKKKQKAQIQPAARKRPKKKIKTIKKKKPKKKKKKKTQLEKVISVSKNSEKITLIHTDQTKMVQLLWRPIWLILRKLNTELPYDLAIPLLV